MVVGVFDVLFEEAEVDAVVCADMGWELNCGGVLVDLDDTVRAVIDGAGLAESLAAEEALGDDAGTVDKDEVVWCKLEWCDGFRRKNAGEVVAAEVVESSRMDVVDVLDVVPEGDGGGVVGLGEGGHRGFGRAGGVVSHPDLEGREVEAGVDSRIEGKGEAVKEEMPAGFRVRVDAEVVAEAGMDSFKLAL